MCFYSAKNILSFWIYKIAILCKICYNIYVLRMLRLYEMSVAPIY